MAVRRGFMQCGAGVLTTFVDQRPVGKKALELRDIPRASRCEKIRHLRHACDGERQKENECRRGDSEHRHDQAYGRGRERSVSQIYAALIANLVYLRAGFRS